LKKVWWLGFRQGPGTAVFTITGILFYLGCRIDHQRHQEIVTALAAARADRDNSK